jgi:hypothetical protein
LDFTAELRERESWKIRDETWLRVIKALPDWKATEPGLIHNFFIKRNDYGSTTHDRSP